MATEIKMPQLGETVVEGTITKWLKQEGEQVEADELLVEISTDKVDSEVPSSAAGVLQKILVPEGETVKVGTPLALVGEGEAEGDGGGDEAKAEKEEKEGEPGGEPEESQAPEGKTDPAPEEKSEDEGEEPAAEKKDDDEEASSKKEESSEASTKPAPPPEEGEKGRPGDQSKKGIISPLVRRLADEHDVDLREVEGSGTGGRIRKQDVLRFVEERKARPAARPAASAEPAPAEEAREPETAPAASGATAVGGREELVPWSNIRRRTAEHMVAASQESARAWNAVEADWTNIANLRGRAKGRFKEREGFSLTYMPFLCKALCETLMEMPEVNASFDQENQANRVKHYVNLGIAVALDGGGLIVPVIKGADEKNLVGLARSVAELANKARTKKLSPDDLTGGTFTITNPGPFGSIISVPIIPRGTTGILGFEAITKRVVVTDDDAIAIRQMGFLSMSWDHRTIDGAEAARFLAKLRERIETTDYSSELAQYI